MTTVEFKKLVSLYMNLKMLSFCFPIKHCLFLFLQATCFLYTTRWKLYIFQNISKIWESNQNDGELYFCCYKGDLPKWRKWLFPKQRFWCQKSLSCRLNQRWEEIFLKQILQFNSTVFGSQIYLHQWNIFLIKRSWNCHFCWCCMDYFAALENSEYLSP